MKFISIRSKVFGGAVILIAVAATASFPDRGPSQSVAEAGHAGVSEQEAYEIGIEAYIYFYSLVSMDVTRWQLTNIEPDKMTGRGPMNTFTHIRAFPSAEFKEVVRPNFDTLYSVAWLDLTREPVIVSVPDTGGRYYLLPMLDMWSDVFAAPGKRTTGTNAASYGVTGPTWNAELPAGIERIKAPTPYVWIIGRTQTNGPKDYAAVNTIQDGFKVTPLSQWGKPPQPPKVKIEPRIDMKTPPLEQVNRMSASAYFTYGAELMKFHSPHLTDQAIVARMKKIGIEPGQSFEFDKLDPSVKKGLAKAAPDALKHMLAMTPKITQVINGWQMNTNTMGVYGNYYLKRAIVAMVGLGANQVEDAVYPMNISDAAGKPLVGDNKYVLHFKKEELPPVNAFWSVTMYDAQGFPAANDLNRFALGDRDSLRYNADGSLDIYLQNENPGKDREANWLPAPKGPLGVTLRLYWPKREVLDGVWNPPAVQHVK